MSHHSMKIIVNQLLVKIIATLLASCSGIAVAGSNPNCYNPPGYSSDKAKWDSGTMKDVSKRLITSSGSYHCQKSIQVTNNPKQPGYKNYRKTVCGPMALVEEITYRPCTIEERAGISTGYGLAADTASALKRYLCATGDNVTHSRRLELVDKSGSRFAMANSFHYMDNDGSFSFYDSCTSDTKPTTYLREYRIGETSATVTIEDVRTEGVRMVAQPSP